MKKGNVQLSIALVLLVALIGLVLWFRGPSQNAVEPTAHVLRVGYIPITDCSQLYVAKNGGYFARHGIEAELIPMASGAAILQGLGSGEIDVAFSNLASVAFYEDSVGPLHPLAGGTLMNAEFSEAGLVVQASTKIHHLEDLRSKTIAVNALRNIVDFAVIRALRLRGVAASEVRLTELSFKDMEAALRGGRIDAAALAEPFLSRAIAAGGLRNLGDHFLLAAGEMYSTGYFAIPRRYSEDRGAFEGFNRAIEEATPIANEYGAEALSAISRETKIAESDLKRAGRPLFLDRLPKSAIDQMRLWLHEEGFLGR